MTAVEITASRSKGRSQGWLLAVASMAFLVSGVAFIGVSVATQRRPLRPPEPAAGSSAIHSVGAATRSGLRGELRKTSLPRSKPTVLDIPAIGVHSMVQHLGQAADGSMEVPAGARYDEAAWYRYSPAPGSIGPAIVIGHVDSAAGGPSVFFRLGELGAGDRISISRADGSVAVFTVDQVRSYAKVDFPTKLVYGNIDRPGLRLVTCGGTFDPATGHYEDNIVVFASLTDAREL